MARVARDARALLGALHSNVEGLRTGFDDQTSSTVLAQGLDDIEACCERLNSMLEDALIGVRREGLTIQRSSVSLSSVFAAALRQVRTRADAKRVSFSVPMQPDVAARLDRTLLTRALVKLMGLVISEAHPGTDVAVLYRLDRGDVTIAFVCNGSKERDGSGPSEPTAPHGGESDLEFCHLVAECHGGTLTLGKGRASGTVLFRIDLPWVA
jgi:signal transduction histidine kinase